MGEGHFAVFLDNQKYGLTDDQTGAMVIMIDLYANARPNTQLEHVIIGFLLTEGRKKVGQGR